MEDDAKLVRGAKSILDNLSMADSAYAGHTLNCNTQSIGLSLCGMRQAVESPFKAGNAPITRAQWDALPGVLADLCRRYGIPVTPQTVLSHAEVQGTLGIKQKGKWNIARLPVRSLDRRRARDRRPNPRRDQGAALTFATPERRMIMDKISKAIGAGTGGALGGAVLPAVSAAIVAYVSPKNAS